MCGTDIILSSSGLIDLSHYQDFSICVVVRLQSTTGVNLGGVILDWTVFRVMVGVLVVVAALIVYRRVLGDVIIICVVMRSLRSLSIFSHRDWMVLTVSVVSSFMLTKVSEPKKEAVAW